MAAAKKVLSVTGAVAVLRLEDGSDRYLYKGAHIDKALYTDASIEHVSGLGLVTEIEVIAEEDAAVEIPEGDPSEDWSGKQLDAFAEAKGIDLSKAKNKADKVAAIAAATQA